MADLATAFATLVRHHIATPAAPLPEASPGITWIWAANGIFKRGVSADLDALVQVRAWDADDRACGLASLVPYARFSAWPGRLDGRLLAPLLADARKACTDGVIARPVEKQYFFVERDGLRVVAPHVQEGTPGSLRYTMPVRGHVLLDLHSHHAMRAYFSPTDDRDDLGLSVSAVIGDIYERPEILIRINVFGDRQQVPALTIFDQLGPFEAKEWRYARTDD